MLIHKLSNLAKSSMLPEPSLKVVILHVSVCSDVLFTRSLELPLQASLSSKSLAELF